MCGNIATVKILGRRQADIVEICANVLQVKIEQNQSIGTNYWPVSLRDDTGIWF